MNLAREEQLDWISGTTFTIVPKLHFNLENSYLKVIAPRTALIMRAFYRKSRPALFGIDCWCHLMASDGDT